MKISLLVLGLLLASAAHAQEIYDDPRASVNDAFFWTYTPHTMSEEHAGEMVRRQNFGGPLGHQAWTPANLDRIRKLRDGFKAKKDPRYAAAIAVLDELIRDADDGGLIRDRLVENTEKRKQAKQMVWRAYNDVLAALSTVKTKSYWTPELQDSPGLLEVRMSP